MENEYLSFLDEVQFLHQFLGEDTILVHVVDMAEQRFDWIFRVVGLLHSVLIILKVNWYKLSVLDEEGIKDFTEVGYCVANEVVIKVFTEGWLDGGEK